MGDRSGIQWTDATWNPVRGCSRVSAGCEHCYAERQAVRQAGAGGAYEGLVRSTSRGPAWTGQVREVPELLDQPLRWRRPRRIFVNSMSDLFHEGVSDQFLDQVFAVMALSPQHTLQVLTKRPARMRAYLAPSNGPARTTGILNYADHVLRRARPALGSIGISDPTRFPYPNVWLGVSVEDQATADERIPLLLETPAAVRFVSYEPALGPVDFSPWLSRAGFVHEDEACGGIALVRNGESGNPWMSALDWIIVGGESGPGARPCRRDWISSTIEQCRTSGTKVFVKQLGAWRPPWKGEAYDTLKGEAGHPVAFLVASDGTVHCTREPAGEDAVTMIRAGGKAGDPTEWPDALRVREFPS